MPGWDPHISQRDRCKSVKSGGRELRSIGQAWVVVPTPEWPRPGVGGPTNRSPVSLVSEGETVLPRQRYFSVWKMVSSYTKLLLCMENEFLLQNVFPQHNK